MNGVDPTRSVHRVPLTDNDVERLAREEMPELTRHLRSADRLVARLRQLNHADPQYDLDGLHNLLDRELAPLRAHHLTHPALDALAEFATLYPTTRAPVITKVAVVNLAPTTTRHHN